MYKYGIVLYRSSEDGAFVAEAPQLPGCMAHGETQEAALRERSTRRSGCGSIPAGNSAAPCRNPMADV